MAKTFKSNRARERRILNEIVVDAYTSDERTLGWYYYLEGKLEFPFRAKCIAARSISPLKKGEEVEVLSMAKEDDCMAEIFVLIRWGGRKLGVPLAQLKPVRGRSPLTPTLSREGRGRTEAVADWHYWVARKYEF